MHNMYVIFYVYLGITRVQRKRLGIVAHRVLEIAGVAPFGVAWLVPDLTGQRGHGVR